MSDKTKDIEVRFKFSLDAKPLSEVTKQLDGMSTSLRDADTGASKFAGELGAVQAKVKQLAASGKLDVFGDDAERQVQEAVTRVDLLTVKLAEAEREAEKAAQAMAEAEEGSLAYHKAANNLAKAEAEAAQLVRTLSEVPTRLEAAADKARQLAAETQTYESRLREQAGRVDVYGDVSSRLSPIAGLAGTVSPEAAEATMIVADIADLGEQLPKLGEAVVEIGGRIQETVKASKLLGAAQKFLTGTSETAVVAQEAVAVAETAVAAEGGMAAPSLGAVAGGLVTITAAAVPFIATIGLVAAAVKGVVDAFQAGSGALDKFLDDQERDVALRKEAALLSRNITKEELEAREEEQRLSVEMSQQYLEDLENQRAGLDEQTAAMGAAFDPLTRNMLAIAAGKLDEKIKKATGALEEDQAALEVTTGELRESAEARWAEEEAVKNLVGETKQLIAETDRRIEGERRVADIVDSMTGEQLKAAQETARQDKQLAREKIAEYKRLADAEEKRIAELEAQGELTSEETVHLEAARENLDLYNQALAESEGALEDAANRLDDYAAAEPMVEQRDREREAVAALEAELQNEIETRDLVRTATREQVREQLAGLDSQEAAIRAMLPKFEALAGSSEEAAQTVEDLYNQLDEIGAKRITLENVVMPAAFEREAKEAWQSGVEAFGKYQEDLAALEAKYGESRVKVVEDAAAKVLDIEAKAAESRAKAIQETAKKLADAETKAVEERTKVIQEQGKSLIAAQVKTNQAVKDLEQDLARDRAKIVQDSAREEARIRRRQQLEDKLELQKHYKTLSDLALARDVAGFVAAQQDYAFAQTEKTATRALDTAERREDTQYELQALKETGQQRIAEIKRQYFEEVKSIRATSAEKLAAIEQERVKEIDAAQRAGAEKLAEIEAQRVKEIETTRAAETKKLADLEAGLLAEQTKRQASYAKELQDLEDHLAGRDATMKEGWDELEAGFKESLAGLGGNFELLTAAGTAAIEAGQVAMTEVVATHTGEQVAVAGEGFGAITGFAGDFRTKVVTATKQLDAEMMKLYSTTKATATEMALLAKSMQAVNLPKRFAAGGNITITLNAPVNNPRFGEFVSPSQYRRDLESLQGQTMNAFRQLVSVIQRKI